MKTYVFETTMTALSSISHNGGQSFGINSKLRREKYASAHYSTAKRRPWAAMFISNAASPNCLIGLRLTSRS
jgi:hypothetical protein